MNIKISHNKNNTNVKQIKKITWTGIALNLFLAFIKFLFGFIGASHAVIADAVHSISDLSTDLAVLLGVKYWSAPPDKNHPYGHRRIETLITLAIGIILAFIAVGLGYNSLTSVREIHREQTSWIAVIGPLLSIVFKEILYRWTLKIGNRVKSTAVIANSMHHRSDALSSLPALIAVTVSSLNPELSYIDDIGALIISVFILKVSWDIVRPSLIELTDHGASEKDRELIKNIVMNIESVKDVHAIRTRKFSSNLVVDLHVLVDPDISVREGHCISQEVEDEILNKGPDIIDVVVHIEPFESGP
ncbi:MAG: cation diffusion facilitator family transporter [Candidatus Krumholzibacteriota bacterium]|nr:cation diffusion facilitator family transporter [Candidatus Krumholzibacteriota bacterium]